MTSRTHTERRKFALQQEHDPARLLGVGGAGDGEGRQRVEHLRGDDARWDDRGCGPCGTVAARASAHGMGQDHDIP